MLDENHGYAGGDGGWIYVTENGGDEWTVMGSIGTMVLDISFPPGTSPDNPIGYACGGSGSVWKIDSNLTNLNSGSSSIFSGVSTSSVEKVWVCGGGSVFFYNGTSFTGQITPAGTFNDIHLINDQKGWLVGNGGVIGNTVNGGEIWSTQVSSGSQFESFYGVFFLDEMNGWAVGGQGTIVETNNGGNDWIEVGAEFSSNIYNGVHFTSVTNGYIVGNNRTLLKYTETTGIGEVPNGYAIDIYPNPTNGKFQITSTKLQANSKTQNSISKLEVVDIYGKVVYISTANRIPQTAHLNISQLSPGVYFVRVSIDNQIIVKKIIKL
jgi:hypothetical protein